MERDTSAPSEDVMSLDGMVMPGRSDGIVLLQMPKCQDYFIPLFTSETLLRSTMAQAGIAFQGLKQIDDGQLFLDVLPLIHGQHRLRIMVDPVVTSEGLRFLEVPRPDPYTA